MKKIVLLFLTVIICNVKCNAQNDFDNVAKCSITDEKASQNGNNRSFNKLYSSIETSKSIEKDFEKN